MAGEAKYQAGSDGVPQYGWPYRETRSEYEALMKELQARRTEIEVQTGRVLYYWPVSL